MTEEVPFAPGLAINDEVQFRKTISESDVYLYAGITGDFSANHIDESFMESTIYGTRIAHGSLLIGFTSTTSTLMSDRTPAISVSAGYDRIRFLNAVRLGDTITVKYRLASMEPDRRRTYSESTIVNQHGEVCAIAVHILQFIGQKEA